MTNGRAILSLPVASIAIGPRIGFGAESALERADVRGSVGPQPVTTP